VQAEPGLGSTTCGLELGRPAPATLRAHHSTLRFAGPTLLPATTSPADADSMDAAHSNGSGAPARAPFKLADHLQTPQYVRLYDETQKLKERVSDLTSYQQAHPRPSKTPSTRDEVDAEKKIQNQLDQLEKRLRAQLAMTRTVYRACVMKIREEKAETAENKAANDALILGLHNLKYEEQSLRSEIAAAQNYDHKYTKLPLIAPDAFVDRYPQHADASEHELTIARIEQEHYDRVELEARRQEKLKQKQKLIAEVKKSKVDLTQLDGMLEKFVEHFEPIRKVLATE
jgi:THO complex subunit 5